jgi:HK97 family phage major capsid protein
MSASKKILAGIKQAIAENCKVTIDLREASTLTGSGLGIGGRTQFDEVFAALRYANPFRMGSRNIKTEDRSAVQFVAKTGNALDQTNPWGYTFTPNSGTPNTATTIWQLPTRVLAATLPIRTAAMDDINGLEEALVADLVLEFGQQEGLSMAQNNDQAGSVTTTTGGTEGLRGLDYYASASASAYGTSGTAMTNGIHSIATVPLNGSPVTYDSIVEMANSLPAQYWSLPTTAWHMKPSMIAALRQLKDDQGMPLFLEIGDADGAAVGRVFGFPVIPNPYLSGDFPIYLANWERFLTIADIEEMDIQVFDQTAPGFVTLFCEKRVVSSVRDPFAGVRMTIDGI